MQIGSNVPLSLYCILFVWFMVRERNAIRASVAHRFQSEKDRESKKKKNRLRIQEKEGHDASVNDEKPAIQKKSS